MQALTGTGSHRAADRIPVLEADRDRWQRLAAAWQNQALHADRLVTKICAEKTAALFEGARLAAELDIVTEAHRLLEQENDELAARLTAARQELAKANAVSVPAAAELADADLEATQELRLRGPLWDINDLNPAKAAA